MLRDALLPAPDAVNAGTSGTMKDSLPETSVTLRGNSKPNQETEATMPFKGIDVMNIPQI
jgi:hypothetical protein